MPNFLDYLTGLAERLPFLGATLYFDFCQAFQNKIERGSAVS